MEDDDNEHATEVAENDGAALELERGTPCRCGAAYGQLVLESPVRSGY
jgi:hypothetical protein